MTYVFLAARGRRDARPRSYFLEDVLDTLQRGVQWMGGAVDWGSIM